MITSFAGSHTDVAALQQQVQRGSGRFLLRMQQYEHVWTPDGCKAAQHEVDAAYRTVDEAFHLLRRWAESQARAHQQLAKLIDSAEFASMMTTVGLPPSPLPPEKLVAPLRDAETLAGPDGWTELDRAIDTSQARNLCVRRDAAEHRGHDREAR